MFVIREGVIAFRGDQPGNHATMFGPDDGKLAYEDGTFDDAGRRYEWRFHFDGVLRDGDRFVFAVADWEVVGRVSGGTVDVVEEKASVHRTEGGKPFGVATTEETVDGEELRKRLAEEGSLRPGALDATLNEARETRARYEEAESIGIQKTKTGLVIVDSVRRKPSHAMRCMFVNPVIPYNQWACYKAGVMNEASFSAHGSAYVSAALKADGHHCWMVDLRSLSDWGHVERTLRVQEYDVAFVGFLSIDVFHAAAVVRLLKEIHPNRPVVVGGLHISIAKERVFPRQDLVDYYCFGNGDLLPDSFKQFLGFKGEGRYLPERYPQADYVILDDGEIAARELVAELSSGRRPGDRTIEGGAVPMEVARHMDRDLFDLNVEAYSPILPFQPTPMATVTWARGCSYKCTYCNLSSQLSNTNVRTKPIELVEEELEDLHRRFGSRLGSIMVHDDLTFHIRHIAEWCELILRRWGPIPFWMQTRAPMLVAWYRHHRDLLELLCRAGLTWVSVGYESGSQRMLDFMRKDATVEENIECGRILDEYGINSFGNFLWGCPTETREEAEETVGLVQKIRPGFLSGSVYCNYPGTKMDAWCRENGYLIGGTVYTRSHLPWQVTVKGIDYGHVNDCVRRAGQYANYLRMPKLLSEDRKRELAVTARGLAIH